MGNGQPYQLAHRQRAGRSAASLIALQWRHQHRQSEFTTSELLMELCGWADKLHASGQLPLGILAMNFTGRSACARDALPMLMQNFPDAPTDPFVPIPHG